jgi:endonuclease/exonuclease/phosphatase family metal-dependent hydrolase
MPFYKPLEQLPARERVHIISNIQNLRVYLKSKLPERTNRSTLLLSTWNLREFSNADNRLEESYWYIAEIISFFDLIAVQEIGNDMTALKKLMEILGYKFDYIVTDTPNAEGGSERIAFIFNTGKVKFKNISGEVNLDSKEQKKFNLPKGFARPPFVVAFQASWFRFNLCNVHIYYGSDKKNKMTGEKDNTRRRNEIGAIAQKLNTRGKKENVTYILVGDMNIEEKGDEYYKALVGDKKNKTGFFIHPKKDALMTNSKVDKSFDQIAFNMHNISLKDLDIEEENKNVDIGVINFYEAVFKDEKLYKPVAIKMYADSHKPMPKNWKFDNWRTFQMSDHLPLWIELRIDFTDQYLETMRSGTKSKTNYKTQIPK